MTIVETIDFNKTGPMDLVDRAETMLKADVNEEETLFVILFKDASGIAVLANDTGGKIIKLINAELSVRPGIGTLEASPN